MLLLAEQDPKRVDTQRGAKGEIQQMQDAENNYEHSGPLLLRQQSPATDNPRQSQHGEKAADQQSDDSYDCGCSWLALRNDNTSSHPEDGKDHDGSYQTQNAAENVKDGNDFDVDIHVGVHILIARIARGWRRVYYNLRAL